MRRRSWSEVYRDLHNLPFDPTSFDVIFGIPRSGLLLALMMAEAHDIQADRVWDIRRVADHYWPMGHSLLVVDDTIREGERFWSWVVRVPGAPETYVYLVDESCQHLPNYYTMKASEWILLPWDEHDDIFEIVLDVDGVIADGMKGPDWDVSVCTPVGGAVEGVRRLQEAGHRIMIHTARWASDEQMTRDWLAKHGFEIEWLLFDKPFGDIYVDDKGYKFEDWDKLLRDLL